jgi:uncharacterized membrane protein
MNWPHLHIALNHLPVFGVLFLLLLLITALLRKSAELTRVTLWAWVALTTVTIPIGFTGDRAFEDLMQDPAVEAQWVKPHEDAADQAVTAVFVLGVLAAVSLLLSRRGRPAPRWSVVTLLAGSLLAFLLLARTANLGGQIRHPEVRPAAGSPSKK